MKFKTVSEMEYWKNVFFTLYDVKGTDVQRAIDGADILMKALQERTPDTWTS